MINRILEGQKRKTKTWYNRCTEFIERWVAFRHHNGLNLYFNFKQLHQLLSINVLQQISIQIMATESWVHMVEWRLSFSVINTYVPDFASSCPCVVRYRAINTYPYFGIKTLRQLLCEFGVFERCRLIQLLNAILFFNYRCNYVVIPYSRHSTTFFFINKHIHIDLVIQFAWCLT